MNPESTESTRMIEFLAWLDVNKKRLIVGAAGVGILAAAIAIYRWHENEKESQASAALLNVLITASRGPNAKPPAASEYAKVAADFSDTHAGGRALLFAAEALFRDGRYAEARTEFEKATHKLEDSSLAATAAFGVAACLDALGKTNEAFAGYQDVTVRHGSTAVAGQAKLALAGLCEARGEASEALRYYSELTNAMVSAWSSEALVRRELLLSRHPELVPTNAPAAPFSAVASGSSTGTLTLAPATTGSAPALKP